MWFKPMSEQSSRILTVPILPLGMLNSFIVLGEQPVLVDTGMPGAEGKILAALARVGFAPKQVALIIITHRHVDHIGGAAALKEVTGAPVAIHSADAEWLRRGEGGPRPPTGWAGRIFNLTGLPAQRAKPCEPNILFEQDFALEKYGIGGGLVLHTPGHTAGSVSVLLPDKNVLAGDLASGGLFIGGLALRNRARKPPYEDDPQTVRQSLDLLLKQGANSFYVGHGGPLSSKSVGRYLAREPRFRTSKP